MELTTTVKAEDSVRSSGEEEDRELLQRGHGDAQEGNEDEANDGRQGEDPDGNAPIDARVIAQYASESACVPRLVAASLGNFLLWARSIWRAKGRLGEVCAIFCAFSSRILLIPLWTLPFIPVLSPVYGHGPVWATSTWRSGMILTHVVSGIAMLGIASLQFDAAARRQNFVLHRLSGYTYVVVGCTCVGTLQGLRQTVADEHGLLETSFIEVASLLWLGTTCAAVRAARRRDPETHKRWMVRSVACALSPVAQRLVNFVLCPATVWLRLSLSGVGGVSSWTARWGEGAGESFVKALAWPRDIEEGISLLRNASGAAQQPAADWLHASVAAMSGMGAEAASASAPPPALWETLLNASLHAVLDGESTLEAEIDRRFPLVLSRDGYGVAEQLVFPASSWLGLLVALLLAELQPGQRASAAASLDVVRHMFNPQKIWETTVGVCRALASSLRYLVCEDKSALAPEHLPAWGKRAAVLSMNVTFPLLAVGLVPLFAILVAAFSAGGLVLVLCVAVTFLSVGAWLFEFFAAMVLSFPFYVVGVAMRLAQGDTVEDLISEELGL